MKFYQTKDSPHPAVLFDPKTGEPLCEFVKGEFETDDLETIGLLMAMGFSSVASPSRNFSGPVLMPREVEAPILVMPPSRGKE